MKLTVCMKWVDARPEIDPISGEVVGDRRWFGASRADQTALETALAIRDQLVVKGAEVTAICAGPRAAEALLREASAAGADRVVRIDLDPEIDAAEVAAAVAPLAAGSDLVLCGDWSLDRGTGSFPAFLAHELGAAQALGCTKVALSGDVGDVGDVGHVVEAERRLDGGRRERVLLAGSAVVSLEAGAELRRAGLQAVLAAAATEIDVVAAPASGSLTHVSLTHASLTDNVASTHKLTSSGPFRPRSREIPAALDDDPRIRLMAVAGVAAEPSVSKPRRLDPVIAAEHVLDQLAGWGIESAERPDASSNSRPADG